MSLPSEPSKIHELIRFGEVFELDLRAYQLRRSGRVLRLERIPMDLLILLVNQPGELVTREQIVERIWGKGVFLDTDNSINGAVRKLRRTLKDDPDRPRFIQTVPGRGYRFIASLKAAVASAEDRAGAAGPPLADGAPPGEGEASPDLQPGALRTIAAQARGRSLAVTGLALLLIVALGGWFLRSRSAAQRQPVGGKRTLAVLPFENLTGDPAQEYFSDGLTEEMISRLGNLDPTHLGVIARTSVARYKNRPAPLPDLARELGVQYVLEGSVRRDAGRVRIAAQLIQVSDQTHLWAHQYDRELNNLLAVQVEIAQAVAREIELSLTDPGERSMPEALSPGTLEAYDLYLKGRYFWNKRTPEGLQQAVEHFQRAVDKDPAYARAYAGLADTYAMMSVYAVGRPAELVPKARTSVMRALELDDRLAEAHTSLALMLEHDRDWPSAEKEFRRAIELDPNYATAHHWYAELLMFQGRFEEALAESERARQIDPLSLIIATDRGAILFYARRYDEAIEQFRAVQAVEPDFPRAHMIIAAYIEKGMFREALAEADRWRSSDDSAWAHGAYVCIYARWGRRDEALKALERFKRANRDSLINPAAAMAGSCLCLGENEKALAWLEQAYREHASMPDLKVNPALDQVRNDPRFQDLVQRLGLDR